MKIVIIEDEPLCADFLISELKQYNQSIEVAAVLGSVTESVSYFKDHKGENDLAFMDVELRDGLSLTIFEKCEIDCPVIFSTAHNNYMKEAFQNNGIEYLDKPLSRERLHIAMEKYHKLKTFMNSDIEDILKKAGLKKNKKSVLTGRRGIEFTILKTEQIAFFYSENYIVFAVDHEGKKHIVETSNLTDLMEQLEETMFFKANRRYILNINYIQKYKPIDRVKLHVETTIASPDEIIIGQENAKLFKRWLKVL